MALQLEEQRSLIEKFVKTNIKFQGNEDLFEDFCNEAFQKSYIIFNSSSSIQKIESYVQKVVNTSIVGVLKDLGRLRRTSSGYVRNREVSLEEVKEKDLAVKPQILPAAEKTEPAERPAITKEVPVSFAYDIEDPKIGIEEKTIKKDLLQRIADAVCIVHSENPEKNYLQIYEARYIREMKQKEISVLLNISQSEVSKRLFELSKLIKHRIET
ncbi:MAG: hypothetical protein K6C94_00020 [Candidatus Gastranaerophilales bacterium]|nr:hypothetical protein [Candidatus Gastranaerophilales bacterium]